MRRNEVQDDAADQKLFSVTDQPGWSQRTYEWFAKITQHHTNEARAHAVELASVASNSEDGSRQLKHDTRTLIGNRPGCMTRADSSVMDR